MPNSPEAVLDRLLNKGAEGEVIEFKSRKTFSDKEMGQYFSALSNEANLQDLESAWMVFGIDDKTHQVVNSNYKDTLDSINALKHFIAEHTTGNLTYRNVYELNVGGNRVLMFEIPAAKRGTPTAFMTDYYGRNGESLVKLSNEKYERISRQARPDWSESLVQNATMDDLDPKAIARARDLFKLRNARLAEESDTWDDVTFLNKLQALKEGRVTVAAMILLGKTESFHKVEGTTLQMRWILRGEDNMVIDGKVLDIPFLLSADEVVSLIRNPNYEYVIKGSVNTARMETYDPYTIREALNNCIAHQNYAMRELITVVEYPNDKLIFVNGGRFIPETVEAVIENDRPANYYRNPHLMKVMTNIGMVDTHGSGIIRMFRAQKERAFPLPEYDFSNDEVELTIYGRIMDRRFADVLRGMPNLSLDDAILLDKVQKHKALSDDELSILRNKGLVQIVGSQPVISVIEASKIDDAGTRVQTVLERESDNDCYEDLIVKYISECGSATRGEISGFLNAKLPDGMSEKQKYYRVSYLLRVLTKSNRIVMQGTGRSTRYVLGSNKADL